MDGFYAIGYGTQSIGMGGVGQAVAQDTLIAASNPAGMVWLKSRIDLGAGWVRLGQSTTLSQSPIPGANQRYRSNRSFFYPELGVNWKTGPCVAWGVSLYQKGAFDVRYRRPLLTEGKASARGLYRQYFLSPSWSCRPLDALSLGVALNIAWGTVAFNGLENLSTLSDDPDHLSGGSKDTIWGLGLTLGWMGQFLERLRLGLSYQTRTWMSECKRYRGFLPDRGEIENPSTLSGGLGILMTPYLLFALDLSWIFWSDVRGFGNRSDSLNSYGSRGGPGFGWRDSPVAKLGISYAVDDCLTIRMGYNYCRAPVIVRNVDNNSLTLATCEHHLTIGATQALRLGAISFAYVHGFVNRVAGPIMPARGGGRRLLCGIHDQLSLSWASCY